MPDPFFTSSDQKAIPNSAGADNPERQLASQGRFFAILNLLFMSFGIFALGFCVPAHAYAASMYALFLVSPFVILAFVLTKAAVGQGYKALYARAVGSKQLSLFSWLIGLALAGVGAFQFLNIHGDMAPVGSPQSYIVMSASPQNHYRRGNYWVTYNAMIEMPEPVLNEALKLEQKIECLMSRLVTSKEVAEKIYKILDTDRARSMQMIEITADEYARFKPNATKINLNVHPGLFGLQWYESTHKLVVDATPSPSGAQQIVTIPDLSKNLPDMQKMHDVLSQRGEKISNDMLVMFTKSPDPVSKSVLDQTDLSLSHLRWDYVYANLPADQFTGLMDDLVRLIQSGTPTSQAANMWQQQVDRTIAQNHRNQISRH